MPDLRRRNCQCCGKSSDEVGAISWSGNCLSCAEELLTENIVGIATHTGFAYRRFVRGIARWAESALLDDLPASVHSDGHANTR